MNKNHMKRLLACLMAATLTFSMAGCDKKAAAASTEVRTIYVETQTPQTGDLSLNTDFIGSVEPDSLVGVRPKVGGTVRNTYFEVGQPVAKGDLLFEIDPVDIQLQVNIAQAQLMQAQAQMDQAIGSSLDVQLAQLEGGLKSAQTAYTNARQNLRDYNDNIDDNMDSVAEGRDQAQAAIKLLSGQKDDAQTAYNSAKDAYYALGDSANPSEKAQAEKDMKAAEAKLNQMTNKLKDAEDSYHALREQYNELDDDESSAHSSLRMAVRNAQVAYDSASTIYDLTKSRVRDDAMKVAKAGLGTATAGFEASAKQLEYTKVYSPIDGVIEAKNVTEDTVTGTGEDAYTVSNKSTITVVFYVPSTAVEQMVPGDRVEVQNGQKSYTGSITEVGTMADGSTGLFKIKATVENPDGSLLTGLSVKISATTAKAAQSMLIAQSDVYYEDGKAYVYLYRDGAAVRTDIQTGVATTDLVEVLSGLAASDQIITSWDPNLTDGAAVTLSSDGAAQSQSAASQEG